MDLLPSHGNRVLPAKTSAGTSGLLRVAAYLQNLDEYRQPTGIGKHTINMMRGLSGTPEVDLRILTPARLLRGGRVPEDSYYAGIKAVGLPITPKYLNRLWVLCGHPHVDRWAPDSDWIYCPVELYVPTGRPRLAVTVHDIQQAEPHLPWAGQIEHRKIRARWKMKMAAVLGHADVLLAVSEFTKARLIDFMGAREERIAVVGNGVEEEFFDIAQRPLEGLPGRGGEPYILAVGGLSPRKSGGAVLALARALARRKQKLRVVVAGLNVPEFAAEAAGVPNVELLGYVAQAELPALIRGAVALIALSIYEGFGIPAAEAMAAGTPAIVSNHAALPALVGDAGIVVDINQPEAIADVVENLTRDSSLRRHHVELGRQRAQQYHWSACVERMVAALRERS